MFLLLWFSTEHWHVHWEVTTDINFFPNLDFNSPKPGKPFKPARIPIGGKVSDWFGSVLFQTKVNWSSRVLFRLVGDSLSLRLTGWVESCRESNILDSVIVTLPVVHSSLRPWSSWWIHALFRADRYSAQQQASSSKCGPEVMTVPTRNGALRHLKSPSWHHLFLISRSTLFHCQSYFPIETPGGYADIH